jgi:outer membrane protein TolC
VGHSHQIYPSGAAASDPTWSITGEVRFSLKGDVPAQMKLAAVSLRTAEAAYLDAELTLISTVSTTFYQLLADKENLTILRDAMTLYQSQYEETKRKYDQGLASELDMLRAELTWRKSGPAVEEAELRYERDMAQFRLTIGAGGEGSPQGVIEERQLRLPGPEELADWHLGRRNDVRTAVLAAEAGKLTARQKSLSARSPTITLSESLPLSGAKSGFAGVDTLKGTFSLSVSIPVNPWLPFSSDGLNIQSAQEDAVTAEMALAYTRKQAALDIREKVDALRQAEEDIATAELSYRIANRVYELSQKSYNAGLESQTDMLNDRQDMVSARQAVLVAEIARIEAVYALAAALGMRVEELYGLYGGE